MSAMEQNRFIQRNKKKILREGTIPISKPVVERYSVKKMSLKILIAYH